MSVFQNFIGTFKVSAPFKKGLSVNYVNNLGAMNMLLWPLVTTHIVFNVTLKIMTESGNVIFVVKDRVNNLTIEGLEHISQIAKSVHVYYIVEKSLANDYNIQDIIASEILTHKYKVIARILTDNLASITLEGVLK